MWQMDRLSVGGAGQSSRSVTRTGRSKRFWISTATARTTSYGATRSAGKTSADGFTIIASSFMPTISDLNWEIKGNGDLDGDGRADLVWRNKVTGQNIIWLINGRTIRLATFVPTIADTTWEICGVGDLNGDRHADVIWRKKVTG